MLQAASCVFVRAFASWRELSNLYDTQAIELLLANTQASICKWRHNGCSHHAGSQRLEELATKGAIDANRLKVRQAQLRQQDRVAKLAAVSGCYIGKEGKPVAASDDHRHG